VVHGWVLWDGYENFPRFMINGGPQGADGGSHWKVAGPLGATVQWDAETTRRVPGELLAGRRFRAWRSGTPGSSGWSGPTAASGWT
jgi:uncharacterized membrane protein